MSNLPTQHLKFATLYAELLSLFAAEDILNSLASKRLHGHIPQWSDVDLASAHEADPAVMEATRRLLGASRTTQEIRDELIRLRDELVPRQRVLQCRVDWIDASDGKINSWECSCGSCEWVEVTNFTGSAKELVAASPLVIDVTPTQQLTP